MGGRGTFTFRGAVEGAVGDAVAGIETIEDVVTVAVEVDQHLECSII